MDAAQLDSLDSAVLLATNGDGGSGIDFVMHWASNKWVWVPAYALLLWWLWKQLQGRVWVAVLGIVATIAAADRISSGWLKPLTHRLRPCHVAQLLPQLHMPDPCGGQFGFVSSHAANSFGLAMCCWVLLGQRHPWLAWLFAWAAFVSYSRVYLAAHYPLDVLAGAGLGVLCGAIFGSLAKRYI